MKIASTLRVLQNHSRAFASIPVKSSRAYGDAAVNRTAQVSLNDLYEQWKANPTSLDNTLASYFRAMEQDSVLPLGRTITAEPHIEAVGELPLSLAADAAANETHIAQMIDGKAIAAQVRSELKKEVQTCAIQPGFSVILVGNRPDSASYVRSKTKAAAECGFHLVDQHFDESVSQDELIKCIDELNHDDKIHGILVQLPLPAHIDEQTVLRKIAFNKDVDGFSAENVGNLALKGGIPSALACTPAGVMELLKRSNVEVSGKHCVVIGRSNIVGTPVALMLMHANATVTICHSRTADIAQKCRQADIVIAALGKPGFVRGDWLKKGAVVIDVGINKVDDASSKRGYKLVGDVNFEEACKTASMITPVPGGVGPMTIAMLLQNTLRLANRSIA